MVYLRKKIHHTKQAEIFLKFCLIWIGQTNILAVREKKYNYKYNRNKKHFSVSGDATLNSTKQYTLK